MAMRLLSQKAPRSDNITPLNVISGALQALAFIYDQSIVKSLFDEAPARYSDRNGGYCRVITEPQRRRGDSTEMAAIELV